LINARGLREEQEAILKNVLTRTGNQDPEVRASHVIPTDPLTIPEQDDVRPIQDLIGDALRYRPDLGQARLQIEKLANRTERREERHPAAGRPDRVMQNNGLAGNPNPLVPNPDPTFTRAYGGRARPGLQPQVSDLRGGRAGDSADPQPHRRGPIWRAMSCK